MKKLLRSLRFKHRSVLSTFAFGQRKKRGVRRLVGILTSNVARGGLLLGAGVAINKASKKNIPVLSPLTKNLVIAQQRSKGFGSGVIGRVPIRSNAPKKLRTSAEISTERFLSRPPSLRKRLSKVAKRTGKILNSDVRDLARGKLTQR